MGFVEVIQEKMYSKSIKGLNLMGDEVEIIGEQTVKYQDRILEQYIYNIVGYIPKNGKPFVAFKPNITIIE